MENVVSPNFADLLVPNVEIKTFPDGDSYVRIPHVENLKGKNVRVYHRLYPKQNTQIIQALFIGFLLKDAKNLELVAPYLPYSRQDKIWLEGELKSSEALVRLLAYAGYKKIITFDCHFLKKEGEFEYGGLKIRNISLAKLLIEHAKSFFNDDFEVISPDAGANYMCEGKHMEKIRGKYIETEAGDEVIVYRNIENVKLDFDVKGKNILILDDMISTGLTMIKAVENVRKNGAKKIAVAATHGFFLGDSLTKLSQIADYIYTSNTILNSMAKVNFMNALREIK